MPLKPGDTAPDCKSLEQRKAWHLIYFYPASDTPLLSGADSDPTCRVARGHRVT